LQLNSDMTDQILTTKLYIPPIRAKRVSRSHLIERLDAGRDSRLILISAPAGFGKTTLISEWIAEFDRQVAWLTLDEDDNDLTRFVSYFVAALRTIEFPTDSFGEIGESASLALKSAQLPPFESILTDLINEITAFPGEMVLCLDDYHLIQTKEIHDALAFFLEHLPPNFHLVILTRADPPLPLARLRGRGQLNEIRASDLRFSNDEATEFLNHILGLSLSPDEVTTLVTNSEGWVTGLQLAGLSIMNLDPESTSDFIEHFSGRYHVILDYLVDEVLSRQPKHVQRFLLVTSILERMTGPLCDAILVAESLPGDGSLGAAEKYDSGALLANLYQDNIFLVPLDEEHRWYRYHQLFKELLQARLREVQPELIPELHRRAAEWIEANGFLPEAVHHALAAEDFEMAADVIHRATQNLSSWSSIDVATLQGWLKALPEQVIHSRPWLRLFESRALYATGRWESGWRILRELEEYLEANLTLPDADRLLMLVNTDQASIAAVQGDVSQAIDYAQRTLAKLSPQDVGMKMRALVILGKAQSRAGEVREAEQAYSQAIALARKSDIAFAAVPFVFNLADLQIAQGGLRQAYETCQQALKMGTVDGELIPVTGYAGLALGSIYYEHNQLQIAGDELIEGLKRLTEGGTADSSGVIHSKLALVRLAQGDIEGAQSAIQKAAQMAALVNVPRVSGLIAAHQARIWLAQGERDLLSEWVDEYCLVKDTEYLREFEDLTLARVMLAENQPSEVLNLLDDLLYHAVGACRYGSVIHIQAIRALAYHSLDQLEDALEALGEALKRGRPEGYVRVFLDGGDPMIRLLREAQKMDIESDYIGMLLSTFRDHSESSREMELYSRKEISEFPQVEPLTYREIEVLQLLAEGLTNAEICQRLYIALPTVKSHNRNIYAKLGVQGRMQAVSLARKLGILSEV
jgi:LuxR family maltose regulon positive regulatory protein